MPSLLATNEFPHARLANGRIDAELYLPDPQAGYYRGTRFDWSGVISSLRWNGHEYFGPWFERHDPTVHDAITGPVEEFLTGDSSLGYDEVAEGGVFVRIGVGAVRRPAEAAFKRFDTYEIVSPGTWAIDRAHDCIEFTHTLPDTGGYGYVYRKRMALSGNTLVLEHELRNTGTKPIATSVYNHNFFTLDRQLTGPDIVLRFPFDARAARPIVERAALESRELRFLRPLEPMQTVFTEVEGFGPAASDYDFRLENRRTGAGVRIIGDRPLSKLLFWCAATTVCPEPYIDASVDAGATATWVIAYEFYTVQGFS